MNTATPGAGSELYRRSQEAARTGKILVRKTPGARHPYRATITRVAVHGWGNTPDEARAKLVENLRNIAGIERASSADSCAEQSK